MSKVTKKESITVEVDLGATIGQAITESVILAFEESVNVNFMANDKEYSINYQDILITIKKNGDPKIEPAAVPMPAQSIMEKCQAEAVAEEDAEEVLFDNLISDIANVIQGSKTEVWEGGTIEYVDGMKAAIKNAIKDHGAEITFHSAEKF